MQDYRPPIVATNGIPHTLQLRACRRRKPHVSHILARRSVLGELTSPALPNAGDIPTSAFWESARPGAAIAATPLVRSGPDAWNHAFAQASRVARSPQERQPRADPRSAQGRSLVGDNDMPLARQERESAADAWAPTRTRPPGRPAFRPSTEGRGSASTPSRRLTPRQGRRAPAHDGAR